MLLDALAVTVAIIVSPGSDLKRLDVAGMMRPFHHSFIHSFIHAVCAWHGKRMTQKSGFMKMDAYSQRDCCRSSKADAFAAEGTPLGA